MSRNQWITGLLVGAVLIALLDLPYGYYQLLRVAVCAGCIFLVLQLKSILSEKWIWALAITAVVYNPLFKLSLGADIWPIVNIITAGLLGVVFWKERTAEFRGHNIQK